MTRRRLFIAIFLLLGTVTAAAQDASEFRAIGGEISMITKKSSGFSGSLGLSTSESEGAFSGLGGKRYTATLGGSLVQDRLWFFASAEQQSSRIGPAAGPVMSEGYGNSNAIDTKVMANLSDRQSLAAIFAQGRQPATAAGIGSSSPSSFLSLRYTGIVSDAMFFTANFSRREGTQPVLFTPSNAGQ